MMTFLQLAAEIERRILNKQSFKKSYGEKTANVYLEFYEFGMRSLTYKLDAAEWEKIKKLINFNIDDAKK